MVRFPIGIAVLFTVIVFDAAGATGKFAKTFVTAESAAIPRSVAKPPAVGATTTVGEPAPCSVVYS